MTEMREQPAPSLARALAVGALGFGLVSLCVFATVAFAERWMYARLGLWGAYLAWTALFILLGGGALGTLARGRFGLPRFYLLFGAAFFAYAVGWVASYFLLRRASGETLGGFVGSLLMGAVFAAGFGVKRRALNLFGAIYLGHAAGYFVGSLLNEAVGGAAGMLLWGAAYGLGLGAGLGAALHLAQVVRADDAADGRDPSSPLKSRNDASSS